MEYIPNFIFALIFFVGVSVFIRNIRKVILNIKLGKKSDRSDQLLKRARNMALLAFGQSKMIRRPIVGILHLIVYLGFIIINIELLEIIIDGLLGTHRVLAPFLGGAYDILIGTFEYFAFLVIISVFIFWIRRNIIRVKRFWNKEMVGWPKLDADLILYFEVILMSLFLLMNASDYLIQTNYPLQEEYIKVGYFPISKFLAFFLNGISLESLVLIERTSWWLHIIGILFFANYLYYSKHLHIILAFPNTFFANLEAKGRFKNIKSITEEVKLMMDPNNDPYNNNSIDQSVPDKFGASDVMDLEWIQLMNAYTCTECGRCTSVCPANQTGKTLSPRKIMMDTRDRLEEVGKNIAMNGEFKEDGKQLIKHYIMPEEIWACTSCNACVEECPIDIDPLSIIMSIRQYLVMEKSEAPADLNNMMSNIENNGAPWPFNQQDRLNWVQEL